MLILCLIYAFIYIYVLIYIYVYTDVYINIDVISDYGMLEKVSPSRSAKHHHVKGLYPVPYTSY